MNYISKVNYINQVLLTKEDVLDSIKLYIEHCETTDEEGWSENKREVILNILRKFYYCVRDIQFPKFQSTDWHYEYEWQKDGIVLGLLHCDDVKVDENGEIISMSSSQFIKIADVKCSYLTVEEYANKYGVTVVAVRQWIRRGKLRSAKKIGRDWIIPELEDKPRRGYEPVTYSWDRLSDEILRQYTFLERCTSLHVVQDDQDKTMFRIILLNKYGKPFEKLVFGVSEREKFELALISETAVESDEWYQNIRYVPAKEKMRYLRGGKIVFEEEIRAYEEKMQLLKENDLEISTSNFFYDEDGKYIWGFSVAMIQNVFDEESIEMDTRTVVNLERGLIIPSESEFGEDDEYDSAADLCDAISGDLDGVYSTIANEYEGIKPEIIKELDMEEDSAFESSILYIEDITAVEPKYLAIFLKLFDFVVEGLPAKYCRFAVVLMNWEKENEKAKVFLECGWKIKNLDARAVVAYRKI